MAGAVLPGAPLRPLAFGELLDRVFRLYRRNFGLLFVVALIVTLPALLAELLGGSAATFGFAISTYRELFTATQSGTVLQPGQLQHPPLINPFAAGAGYLVLLGCTPFTLGALPLAGVRLATGAPISLGTVFREVLHRYWALLGLTMLLVLISFSFLCLPLGIWLLVRLVLSIPAVLVERAGPARALGRSWDLLRGGWWYTFGILVLLYLIAGVASNVLAGISYAIAFAIPSLPQVASGGVVLAFTDVASALTTPLIYLGIALIYLDRRVRREGLDLDQMARLAASGADRSGVEGQPPASDRPDDADQPHA